MNTKDPLKPLIDAAELVHQAIQNSFDGKAVPQAKTEILMLVMFMRITDNFIGVARLAGSRAPVNSFIILRSMSETYVLLKKVSADPAFAGRILTKSRTEKIRHIGKVIEFLDHLNSPLSTKDWEEIKNEQINDLTDRSSFNIATVFKETGELKMYIEVYLYCGNFTHADAGSFDRYLEPKNGEFNVDYSHPFVDSAITLFLALGLYVNAAKILGKLVQSDLSEIDNTYKNFSNYWNEIEPELRAKINRPS